VGLALAAEPAYAEQARRTPGRLTLTQAERRRRYEAMDRRGVQVRTTRQVHAVR
jgi:hypothetical protein